MKFEIAFNRPDKNDKKEFYDFIGAELVWKTEFTSYMIELDSFEDLKILMEKINMELFGNTFEYSVVISFDSPTIYLDNKV